MKTVSIVNRWTKVPTVIFLRDDVQAEELHRKMLDYRKVTPKGYNRNKRKRLNCKGIDEVFKKLTGNPYFYFSDYTGKQYEFNIGEIDYE